MVRIVLCCYLGYLHRLLDFYDLTLRAVTFLISILAFNIADCHIDDLRVSPNWTIFWCSLILTCRTLPNSLMYAMPHSHGSLYTLCLVLWIMLTAFNPVRFDIGSFYNLVIVADLLLLVLSWSCCVAQLFFVLLSLILLSS